MITIDIETSPTIDENIIRELTEGIRPPANYKNPESIKQWMDGVGQEKARKAVYKTALDGLRGSIRCIGVALDDEEPLVLMEDSENDTLRAFFDFMIDDYLENNVHSLVIGHNLIGFDLPFIRHRAIVTEVGMPRLFKHYYSRFSEDVYDTMYEWAGWNGRVSLNNLAYGLLGRSKLGFGGEVHEMSDEQVVEYCAEDVRLTRDVYYKMTFTGETK